MRISRRTIGLTPCACTVDACLMASAYRERVEKRVRPLLTTALEPGEQVVGSGFALGDPARWKSLIQGTWLPRQFWIAATDRRLLVFLFPKVRGPAELEFAVRTDRVSIGKQRRGPVSYRLILSAEGRNYRLRFPPRWWADGERIAAALGARGG